MKLFKGWFDYKLIKKRLIEEEDLRLNCISLLMEVKPYRRSIFNQICSTKSGIHTTWTSLEYSQKELWIKENMYKKWTTDQFVAHIISSIKLLRFNKMFRESFQIILGEDLK